MIQLNDEEVGMIIHALEALSEELEEVQDHYDGEAIESLMQTLEVGGVTI